MSHCVVDVFVDRKLEGDEQPCLVEPSAQLLEKFGLLMLCGIIDLCNETSCKVIVTNISNESVFLYPETVIGHVEEDCDLNPEIDPSGLGRVCHCSFSVL